MGKKEGGEGEESSSTTLPLFESKAARYRGAYRAFAATIFVCVCLIWVYRLVNIPKAGERGRWAWIGMIIADVFFGLYWIITQSVRWSVTYRQPLKNRLSQRYEDKLPGVDVFICTADPKMEPPSLVINTVLSVLSCNFPSEKLSVYLSDDGGSEFTFYALLEASRFSKYWIPFCKKFKVEPRAPEAYFALHSDVHDIKYGQEWLDMKKLYDEMKNRIDSVVESGKIPVETRIQHKGFSEWNLKVAKNDHHSIVQRLYKDMENKIESAVKLGSISEEVRSKHKCFSQWNAYLSPRDHDTILQIVIDGRDPNARDVEGCGLPTLVYLAREKRPQHHHNFKAGSMNALIRVSSNISNGKVILNVDCDMYSNNSTAIRDALCFLMDEEKGHEIAFVQFPQNFENVTKNDLYSSSLRVICEVEFHGLDGYGGTLYIGSGCVHRRDTLCGRKFSKGCKSEMKWENRKGEETSIPKLEESSNRLASCTFEVNTQWGKEMGLKYGCPVEDVITGLSIQCRGWKSVYCNPTRKAFLGVAPTTLPQTLVQHKRWSEGDFQILVSKYSPVLYGQGKISLGLQLCYCCYCLWAPNCLATLFYSILPSLYLLKDISVFPQITSPWFIPFAYVIIAKYTWSFGEFMWSGGTMLGWWNDQRIWLYKRTSSYLFAFIDTILHCLGYSDSGFVITAKVADEDVSQRYEKEIMEFGASSPMFVILATVALLNLYCFAGFLKEAIARNGTVGVYETMVLQILLCGVLIVINLPLYEALCLRKDNGKMPSSVVFKSMAFVALSCVCSKLLN